MRFKFLGRRTVLRVMAALKPFQDEFNQALSAEEATPTSAADEKAMILRALICVSESVLDEAVPDLKRADPPGPLVLEDALDVFERRAAATARYGMVMSCTGRVARRLGVSQEKFRVLHDQLLGERMLRLAEKDAEADESGSFDDRLLASAQRRAVSLQRLARAAVAGETLGVPDVHAVARANAAISVARRLEGQILGMTSASARNPNLERG